MYHQLPAELAIRIAQYSIEYYSIIFNVNHLLNLSIYVYYPSCLQHALSICRSFWISLWLNYQRWEYIKVRKNYARKQDRTHRANRIERTKPWKILQAWFSNMLHFFLSRFISFVFFFIIFIKNFGLRMWLEPCAASPPAWRGLRY